MFIKKLESNYEEQILTNDFYIIISSIYLIKGVFYKLTYNIYYKINKEKNMLSINYIENSLFKYDNIYAIKTILKDKKINLKNLCQNYPFESRKEHLKEELIHNIDKISLSLLKKYSNTNNVFSF